MPKKNKQKHSLYQFGMLEGSIAIQQHNPENESQENIDRVSCKKFLSPYNELVKNLNKDHYPHHNRLLAYAHSLSDTVVKKAKDKLAAMKTPVACESGCDACCYYTDMDATGGEFEEIIHYMGHEIPAAIKQALLQQVVDEPDFTQHSHKPCPFLVRSQGCCGIYPVRPMGCRSLLATKKCLLEVQEDTGLQTTVQLVQQAWKEMPVRAGSLMVVQEQARKGKGHANINQSFTEFLVKFEQLESKKLEQLFA
ncbi:MAG: YkgJ family cysteine cluster protein [SAR324 cluster bacterium]|nr:YkgJ family cysteine cluster protein [SAR324 cluster bacterium]